MNAKGDNRFHKVKDSRNRRLRGLWQRNGTFYVQTTVTDAKTGHKRLTKLSLKAKAVEEAKLEALQVKADGEKGLITKRVGSPTFGEYRAHYAATMQAAKAEKTLHNEKHYLKRWEDWLKPNFRITEISPSTILAYRNNVTNQEKNSNRTANLHVRAMRQLLKLAKLEGIIAKLATEDIKPLREESTERRLMTMEELLAMGTEAIRKHPKSGAQFANYLAFLMYSGARCGEALLLTWDNIDWNAEQVVFTDAISKGDSRRIDFNRNLKNLLLTMSANRVSKYLFPSPRPSKKFEERDLPVTSFKKIMEEIREELELPEFTFHLTRHFFISQCVMSGIDYLTIAKWVGHKDGGVLIGKTYGHLDRAHMKAQATKLRI